MAGPLREAVVLTSGQTESAIWTNHWRVTSIGLWLPANLTGTTVSFKVAVGGVGTFVPLHDKAGTLISYTVAASRAVTIENNALAPWEQVKFVFGTAQGTTTSFYVVGMGSRA